MIYFFSRKVLKPVSESYEKTDCKTDFPHGKTGVSLPHGRFPQFQDRGLWNRTFRRVCDRESTQGQNHSQKRGRKINLIYRGIVVSGFPLSPGFYLVFNYGMVKRVPYKTCSNCGFISVRILTFLIVYIHSEMDSPHNVFVCGHTSFLSVSCASYMPENQQMSRSKITRAFFDF